MFSCEPSITGDGTLCFITPVDGFDLQRSLTCGQAFNYYYLGNSMFCIKLLDYYTVITQTLDGTVVIQDTCKNTKDVWCPYLDLFIDYDKSLAGLALNEFESMSASYSEGIHILRQDPWEMCISYIISQRNKIENISNIVKRISGEVGKYLGTVNNGYQSFAIHAFPTIEELAKLSVSDLRSLSTGFRADYIYYFTQYVSKHPELLTQLGNLNHDDLVSALMCFDGIGPKVANCISLFGFHHTEAFPVDLWMERIINQKFNGVNPANRYGDMAGVIQQYMFNYVRNGSGLSD